MSQGTTDILEVGVTAELSILLELTTHGTTMTKLYFIGDAFWFLFPVSVCNFLISFFYTLYSSIIYCFWTLIILPMTPCRKKRERETASLSSFLKRIEKERISFIISWEETLGMTQAFIEAEEQKPVCSCGKCQRS